MTRGDQPADEPAKKGEQAPDAAPPDSGDALRKKLLTRAVVAAVLVAALLAVLAVFDTLNAPAPKPPPAAVASPPEESKPEAAKSEEAKVETPPAEVAAGDKQAAVGEVKKAEESAATEEKSAAPTTPAAKPERPLTKKAEARPAMMKPSEPAYTARRPEPGVVTPAPLTQLQRPPPQPGRGAPASRPLTQAAEAIRGFVLQLGVFNNTANAEELRAKLELNGIPSQIEARVQVGPFKTREAAEAARDKLRALGMEPGVLVALKK